VGLDDALRVLVVFAERRDARYERAAARFAARVMLERRLGLAEARYVLALAEARPAHPTPSRSCCAPAAADRGQASPSGGDRSSDGWSLWPARRMQRVMC
jgi:hypothetical protein